MKAAIHVGISRRDYDEMTPYELNLHIIEHSRRMKAEHEERVAIAYLNAQLQRAQRMPKLEKLLGAAEQEKPKKQTPEDMLAAVKQLHAAFGGETI